MINVELYWLKPLRDKLLPSVASLPSFEKKKSDNYSNVF